MAEEQSRVREFFTDPKNLATAFVLAAALAQPRQGDRGAFGTLAQRAVGALGFRGGMETGIAQQERQRTLDAQAEADRLRQAALEGERNKTQRMGVDVQAEGVQVQREGQQQQKAEAEATRTFQAEQNRQNRGFQLQLRNTPQAQSPAEMELERAQAGYYNRMPAFAPGKQPLKDQFTNDANGARGLMASVASIASMTDPMERSNLLKDYFPVLGQFGIIMSQDPKTGAIAFQVPDELESQIRALGPQAQGGPPMPAQAPVPQVQQPQQPMGVEQALQFAGQRQQQQQQQQQQQTQELQANAAAYRAARGKIMTLNDAQLAQLLGMRQQLDWATQQAVMDEAQKRGSFLTPPNSEPAP